MMCKNMKLHLLFLLLILISFVAKADNIDFTDNNFKSALLSHEPVIDTDANGQISEEEASVVLTLNVVGKSIDNINDIFYFTNLQALNCKNNLISNIDISFASNLKNLIIANNPISSLNTGSNPMLSLLSISNTNVTYIDFSANFILDSLHCNSTGIFTLNLTNNTNLTYLDASHNGLASINLTNNVMLKYIDLHSNSFVELVGTENLSEVEYLDIDNCLVKKLDISNMHKLRGLFTGHPLDTLCANEQQIAHIATLDENGDGGPIYDWHIGINAKIVNCQLLTGSFSFNRNQKKAYPNPCKGVLRYSRSAHSINDNYDRQVLLVKAEDYTADLSRLNQGIYFIKYIDGTVERVVVN